eukprot:SAG22_NODE_642_length_8224_cov_21.479508_1_plen_211_part_00
MGDESLVAQMEKLQVGEARVGDVVRLSPDAAKSPIKMRGKNLFVRAVSKSGKITYSPKKTGGKKDDFSTTTPDRLLMVKKAPDKKVKTPNKQKDTKRHDEGSGDPMYQEMVDKYGLLANDIIFTHPITYDYMSAMIGADVKEFFDPCPGDWRHGKDWDGLVGEWGDVSYVNQCVQLRPGTARHVRTSSHAARICSSMSSIYTLLYWILST